MWDALNLEFKLLALFSASEYEINPFSIIFPFNKITGFPLISSALYLSITSPLFASMPHEQRLIVIPFLYIQG